MVSNPEMKAASIVNLFETMIRSKCMSVRDSYTATRAVKPSELLWLLTDMIAKDTTGLILERELRYSRIIHWQLLNPETRQSVAAALEKRLLDAIETQSDPKRKTSIFRSYIHVALTQNTIQHLYSC